MIPRKKYLECPEFTYITMKLFKEHHTEEELERFSKWMCGQTCSAVDGEAAIYSWDYERWINQGKQVGQGPDWD